MRLGEFFGALRRRWLLVVVGFAVAAGMAWAGYTYASPTYEIKSVILFVPPKSAVEETGNPFLQLGGLRQSVELVGATLSDQNTRVEMDQISSGVDYTVAADSQSSSPLLVIDVKDSSPEAATRVRDLLEGRVPQRLDALQRKLGVSGPNLVTSSLVIRDAEALEVGRNRLRAAMVLGLVGVVATLALVAMVDSRRGRSRARDDTV